MELIGEAVPYWNACVLRKFFNRFLGKAAVLNSVVHTSKHARGVLHRLLYADLAARRAKIRHMGALVVGGGFKRAAGTGGSLFKDEGYVLALQARLFAACVFCLFELSGKVQEILDFLGAEVQQFKETAVSEIVCHSFIKELFWFRRRGSQVPRPPLLYTVCRRFQQT